MLYPDIRTNISFIFQKTGRIVVLCKRLGSDCTIVSTMDRLDINKSLYLDSPCLAAA